MGNKGIHCSVLVQTSTGGDRMQEITLGTVTYEVQRVYQGDRPVTDLIAERIAQNVPEARPVDGGARDGL